MNQHASPICRSNLLAIPAGFGQASRWIVTVLLLLAAALMASGAGLAATPGWIERGSDGEARVHLYFFWSETCPHCLEAHPFIEAIPVERPWVKLHALEVSRSRDNVRRFEEMAGPSAGASKACRR